MGDYLNELKLKNLIKGVCDELICETHENVCRLRDENYPNLESMIINRMFKDGQTVSAQTAIAELEMELSH
jgi:hypothetical protein